MAKTKEVKAEKPSKISNEDLNSLQELVNDINRTQIQIGMLESQKHTLLHSISKLNDKMVLLRENYKDTYGTDDINIVDGTINRNEIN